MSVPILTFFNNKGGVGKTSLIYHLAWMYADLGKTVVAVDLDPQANLTAAFLDEDAIDHLWNEDEPSSTIYQCVQPLSAIGDLTAPKPISITPDLHLIPGDVGLSSFEDTLAQVWPSSMDGRNLYRPMRILSAFWQVIQLAVDQTEAEIVLVDIGPNLGAINRSVLIGTDYVVIPLGADLFSLQGLRNLGPTLRDWKDAWAKRLNNWKNSSEAAKHKDFKLPSGHMQPIDYLCQQHSVRLNRPVQAYDKWVNRIPSVYRQFIVKQPDQPNLKPADDPQCLATIKHYRSLIPMSQESRKPIFHLTAADGAIGSHANAVQDARKDFECLARKIAQLIGLVV